MNLQAGPQDSLAVLLPPASLDLRDVVSYTSLRVKIRIATLFLEQDTPKKKTASDLVSPSSVWNTEDLNVMPTSLDVT